MLTHPAKLDEKSGTDALRWPATWAFAVAQTSPANTPTARRLAPEDNRDMAPLRLLVRSNSRVRILLATLATPRPARNTRRGVGGRSPAHATARMTRATFSK